ncbi:MrcB family domain-containing protein [Aquimarina pacifica]|uniref:MrcB family domain-containing protein n=1 Tax=Aquimarina pacifica TaxID=1296415 RepID=UPI000472A409|nr:DUF3578 domain-containing protein [Aquimarina pacifica]
MENILSEAIENYLTEKSKSFRGNKLAAKFRKDFPSEIEKIIVDKNRFKVVGSPGKGNWTECPWIAILDVLITDSPQKGYYPVLIYKSDMSGIYLSLNQGVTDVIENYKKEAISVLKLRAQDFRAKIDFDSKSYLIDIDLSSTTRNAKHYQAGNIIAKYYPKENLPSLEQLRIDLIEILELYENLTYTDNSFSDDLGAIGFEKKQIRLHRRIERNTSLSKKVKKLKGYRCEACQIKFTEIYGDIGKDFIEAHHLNPISKLGIGNFKVDLKNDFAILCSNCHSMIHKLNDPSDLNKLKQIIKNT